MACKTETKMIGEHEYSATQWPAEKAILNKLKLLKMFGPAFSILAEKGTDQAEQFSKGLKVVFESSQPEELASFLKNTVVGASRDGEKITASSFTAIFSGDELLDVYKVFLFIIQANYSNLLKGQWGEKLASLAKEADK